MGLTPPTHAGRGTKPSSSRATQQLLAEGHRRGRSGARHDHLNCDCRLAARVSAAVRERRQPSWVPNRWRSERAAGRSCESRWIERRRGQPVAPQ